jgi:hypothetical protein
VDAKRYVMEHRVDVVGDILAGNRYNDSLEHIDLSENSVANVL